MKLKNNCEKPNVNGVGIIIKEIEQPVSVKECNTILRLSKKEYQKQYRQRNKEKNKLYFKNYYRNNKEKLVSYYNQYREHHKDELSCKKKKYYRVNRKSILRKQDKRRTQIRIYSRKYYAVNRVELTKKCSARLIQRYKTDLNFRLKSQLRNRIKDACKNKNFIKSQRTMDILGCNLEQLKSHLEAQFVNGMTWGNHGRIGWHIDHIIPLDTAKTIQDMERLCHYKNLQPLWWYDNLSKGNK